MQPHSSIAMQRTLASAGAQMLLRRASGVLNPVGTSASSPTNSVLGAVRKSSSCPNFSSVGSSCGAMEPAGRDCGSSSSSSRLVGRARRRSGSCSGGIPPTWLARVASASFRSQQLARRQSTAATERPASIQEEGGGAAADVEGLLAQLRNADVELRRMRERLAAAERREQQLLRWRESQQDPVHGQPSPDPSRTCAAGTDGSKGPGLAAEMFKEEYPTLCGVIGGVGPEASADFLLNGVIKGRARLFRRLEQHRLKTSSSSSGESCVDAASEVSSADWSHAELMELDELREANPSECNGRPSPRSTDETAPHSTDRNAPLRPLRAGLGDQSHVPLLLYDNPQIPDRTTFILNSEQYGGDARQDVGDPGPALAATALALVEAGATNISVVCNTAHFFLPAIREAVPQHVQVLDMIELTILRAVRLARRAAAAAAQQRGEGSPPPPPPLTVRLGLLATTGTCQTGIYGATAARVGAHMGGGGGGVSIEVLTPGSVEGGSQADVHDSIYRPRGIKAGYVDVGSADGERNFELLMRQATLMAERGATTVIAGCTELPLVLTPELVAARDPRITVLNPAQVLADELVYLTLRERRRPPQC
jgi:aspartate racemase